MALRKPKGAAGPITLHELGQALGVKVTGVHPPPPPEPTSPPFSIDAAFLAQQRATVIAQRQDAEATILRLDGILQFIDFLQSRLSQAAESESQVPSPPPGV